MTLQKGIIVDACATTSIEEICDLIQDNILQQMSKEGKSLTMRYSPGYGDLDISANKDILQVLDAHKRIGVTVTNTGIMIPRKSVVALIGITNKKKQKLSEHVKIVLIDLTVNIEERLMVVEVRQYIQDNILIFDGQWVQCFKKGLQVGENTEVFGYEKS